MARFTKPGSGTDAIDIQNFKAESDRTGPPRVGNACYKAGNCSAKTHCTSGLFRSCHVSEVVMQDFVNRIEGFALARRAFTANTDILKVNVKDVLHDIENEKHMNLSEVTYLFIANLLRDEAKYSYASFEALLYFLIKNQARLKKVFPYTPVIGIMAAQVPLWKKINALRGITTLDPESWGNPALIAGAIGGGLIAAAVGYAGYQYMKAPAPETGLSTTRSRVLDKEPTGELFGSPYQSRYNLKPKPGTDVGTIVQDKSGYIIGTGYGESHVPVENFYAGPRNEGGEFTEGRFNSRFVTRKKGQTLKYGRKRVFDEAYGEDYKRSTMDFQAPEKGIFAKIGDYFTGKSEFETTEDRPGHTVRQFKRNRVKAWKQEAAARDAAARDAAARDAKLFREDQKAAQLEIELETQASVLRYQQRAALLERATSDDARRRIMRQFAQGAEEKARYA